MFVGRFTETTNVARLLVSVILFVTYAVVMCDIRLPSASRIAGKLGQGSTEQTMVCCSFTD